VLKLRIILATSNNGKVKEIQEFFNNLTNLYIDIIPYTNLIDKVHIIENGKSFKENAIIKAKTIYNLLEENGFKNNIVLADDSGISIKALNWQPNIYSARYSGINASDKENLEKVISELKKLKINQSDAFYTVAIAIATSKGIQTVHGWMHGQVISTVQGKNGFGYDPIFIPKGYNKTIGNFSLKEKKSISHRTKALKLIKFLLKF
jgi:XTP/dITP diphosphohydrolase